MVIEDLKDGDPKPIRERFVRDGRMLPDGVIYHASWVDPANLRCFQVMEAASQELLDVTVRGMVRSVEEGISPCQYG